MGACLNSEGSQVRRFSSPKVLKSENRFLNGMSKVSIRLCPSRLKLLPVSRLCHRLCMINVEKY